MGEAHSWVDLVADDLFYIVLARCTPRAAISEVVHNSRIPQMLYRTRALAGNFEIMASLS